MNSTGETLRRLGQIVAENKLMSGSPELRLSNQTESEERPVLGPRINKTRSGIEWRKQGSKPKSNVKEVDEKRSPSDDSSPSPKKKYGANSVSILQKKEQDSRSFLLRSNLSMNASCSSDASTDSCQSRASTGRLLRRSATYTGVRGKVAKVEKSGSEAEVVQGVGFINDPVAKKRCAWVTSNTDPLYAAFHDEEWGVPVHEDKKLFELISLCTALAELTWPTILGRRQIFRELFHDFDPVAVAKLNEKKIIAPGSPATVLLSDLKLRAIIENARQTCKIIEEHGSFDKYIWSFVNYKPIVGHFRYPRQVPIKTSKADAISKDLVRRGFRGIGPTVVYTFMQVAGLTNDHIVTCFRFQDCVAAADTKAKVDGCFANNIEGGQFEDDEPELELERRTEDLSLSG